MATSFASNCRATRSSRWAQPGFGPGLPTLITDVAAEIVRIYPDQIVGVEGHTDNDPVPGGQGRNGHELSVARAMTVYDMLDQP